jgi:hypothetical protein
VQGTEQVHDVAVQADPEQGPALGRGNRGAGQPEQAEQESKEWAHTLSWSSGSRACHSIIELPDSDPLRMRT